VPQTADPSLVPGLPESRLSPDQLAQLPASSPAPPWTCQAKAVVWVQRGSTPEFEWRGRVQPLAMVCFVQYLDTPVGTYHEVLAGAFLRDGLRPRLQVPFIAVDSLASVHGGRANWALPKTLAGFEGDIGRATAKATGDGWSVSVQPLRPSGWLPSGLRLPIRSRFRSTGPLGVYATTMRATGRPILLGTEVEGETLTAWLGSGRHLGMAFTGRMRIDAPQ
jgi:Acetoacetate decarboxylase (ADC)